MAKRTQTLAQWLVEARRDHGYMYAIITHHSPAIGIHDTRAIEQFRTYLWDLADYRVESVQAGVIWLSPLTAREVQANG